MSESPQAGLFSGNTNEPLAARMRPRTLDEFIGQDRIVGPGRLLRRAIQADQLSSVIFYGPPGTGKTTLARVIANTTRAQFTALNAVLAGVKDIRSAVSAAQEQRHAGRRTILFVDEVHRFNKAQQDALLPWVENGTVILIGATTENPYFEVNKALVSRSRVFELTPLTESDLRAVAAQALADEERGYGSLDVVLHEDALDHLVNVSNGDARALLNALELAVDTTAPDADGQIVVTREVAEESIQRRAVLYDKEGDAHFDTISAFIKSVRGSDPDAALYWLAKMVYAGEDPRYIFRRLLILASEDVGLAEPNALTATTAAAQAFDYVGLPEGRFHLAQATLYLATAPKSNSTLGFFDALAAVEREREAEVPDHLKDANRDAEGLGHGQGYAYPHAYQDHWVAQQYLPEALQGKLFYQPSDVGFEASIATEVTRRREAQVAAMLEAETGVDDGRPAFLSPRPRQERAVDRWLERTVSSTGARLAKVRDAMFELARPAGHANILDLDAGSGLLIWEALRRAPTGQTWAIVRDARTEASLREQAESLPRLHRPVVVAARLEDLLDTITAEHSRQARAGLDTASADIGLESTSATVSAGGVALRFDAVLGRGVLERLTAELRARERGESADADDHTRTLDSLTSLLGQVGALLADEGVLVLAEPSFRATQRLYDLVDLEQLRDAGDLARRLISAEDRIYQAVDAIDGDHLVAAAGRAGLTAVRLTTRELTSRETLAPATVARWFEAGDGNRPSYADHLLRSLSPGEVDRIRSVYFEQLAGATVKWTTTYSLITASAPGG